MMLVKKIIAKIIIYSWLLLISMPLYAWDLFTHAGLNLPFEYQSEGTWFMDIDTRAKWESFWINMIPPELDPDSELWLVPRIDFSNYRILAAGLGRVYSGGYGIHVNNVIDGGNELFIFTQAYSPGAGCVVTANVNHPTVAILIPVSDKRPIVNFSTIVRDCVE